MTSWETIMIVTCFIRFDLRSRLRKKIGIMSSPKWRRQHNSCPWHWTYCVTCNISGQKKRRGTRTAVTFRKTRRTCGLMPSSIFFRAPSTQRVETSSMTFWYLPARGVLSRFLHTVLTDPISLYYFFYAKSFNVYTEYVFI